MKRWWSAWLLTLFAFAMFNTLLAQETGVEALSLEDCIRIALENNSQLKIVQYQKSLASRQHRQSYSNILPQVNFTFDASTFKRGPTFYIGNEFVGENPLTNKTITGENYSASLVVSQNLFDGGFWWNNIRKTAIDQKSTEFRFMDQRQQTIVTVQQAYFTLLQELKLLDVYKQAVNRSAEQLERSEKMYELGAVAQVDVFRARVNLGNDRIQYLNQKNAVEKARQNLNLAMGRDPNTPLEIQQEFSYSRETASLDELLKQALANNPGIKELEQTYHASRLQIALAKSSFLPRLSAFYTYSRRVPDFKAIYKNFEREFTWTLGVRLTWNLFNGFSDYLNIQQAKINARLSSERLLESRRNLLSTVKTLYDNLQALNEIIKINQENLESAREEYRLAQERYRIGSGTALELREAQVNLTRAEQILVSAEYDAIITHAQLQAAVGGFLNQYVEPSKSE